ncbi:MAG: TolC family protein [Bryobacterales bacterium]|nr:TolC family protein [Bryobacterales bacterium]
MRVRRFLFVLAILGASALSGQQPLTLAGALREAITNHPLLAAADGRVSTAQGLLEQASLKPNPRLSLQMENVRGGWQTPYRPFTENDHFIYLSQTLETARKRERRTGLAEANKELAAIARDLLAQRIAAQVREAFWAALGAARITRVYKETLTNFAQTVSYHEVRVREGNMAEADLIRVRLEMERMRLAAAGATLAAERATINLQREMGRTAFDENLTLSGEIDTSTPMPPESPEEALSRRAEVRLARQAIGAAMANEQLQAALARPDIDLSGGYKRTNGYDGLLAYMNMDLPWRNKNQGNIAAAGAETRVARSNAAAAEAMVRAEVRAAYSGYRLRQGQITGMLRTLTAYASDTARIAQAAYREGGADLLRLLDAERVRLDTELLRVQAQTELRLSESAVETAMGVMP